MVDAKKDWIGLTGIGLVIRETEHLTEKKKTSETACYFGSIDNVVDFSKAARMHWGMESMHWSLDIVLKDDQNQTRESVSAQNLATVSRIAFNVLKQETEGQPKPKMSKPQKRTSHRLMKRIVTC